MSYQNKKKKKSSFNKSKFRMTIIWKRLWNWLKTTTKKEDTMRLPGTIKIMAGLRQKGALIRRNNQKINEWVDDLINTAISNGQPITLLTQCCVSKDLEARYQTQGQRFIPTKKEQVLFERELPAVAKIFMDNGVKISWILSFNRSYLDSARIEEKIEQAYKLMMEQLAQPLVEAGWLLLLDWEDDVLGRRFEVDTQIIPTTIARVSPGALAVEVDRHGTWARNDAGMVQSDEEIWDDVCYKIACDAVEAQALTSEASPFGEFLLIPLEMPERYDFFTLFVPDFKKRIVAVLPFYPWRLNS